MLPTLLSCLNKSLHLTTQIRANSFLTWIICVHVRTVQSAPESYRQSCESAWALGGELCHLPAPGRAQTQGSHDQIEPHCLNSSFYGSGEPTSHSQCGCNHTTHAMRSKTLQRHPFHPCPRWNNKIIIQRWKGSSVSWSLGRPRDSGMIQATHACVATLAPSQQLWMCCLLSSDCVLITIAAGTPVHVESTSQLL